VFFYEQRRVESIARRLYLFCAESKPILRGAPSET
jgi:hypothetical protein